MTKQKGKEEHKVNQVVRVEKSNLELTHKPAHMIKKREREIL